jgi:hypothetical protein
MPGCGAASARDWVWGPGIQLDVRTVARLVRRNGCGDAPSVLLAIRPGCDRARPARATHSFMVGLAQDSNLRPRDYQKPLPDSDGYDEILLPTAVRAFQIVERHRPRREPVTLAVTCADSAQYLSATVTSR